MLCGLDLKVRAPAGTCVSSLSPPSSSQISMSKQDKKPNTPSNPKNSRPKRTKPITRRDPQTGVVSIKLPACSIHYTHCIADPFNCPAGACIPAELFPLPSNKGFYTTKGRFACGTSGTGFFLMNPPIVGDRNFFLATSSTSVGTSATGIGAFTNTTTGVMATIPFNAAAITAGNLQGRIVGYGLRVCYIGNLMNANGEVFSYEEPDHQNLGALTPANIEARLQCSRRKVATVKSDYAGEVFYSGPVQPSDVEFLGQAQPLDSGTGSTYLSGVFIEGTAGDLYDYEVVVHLEHIGNSAGGRTMSHSEPQLTGKTIEAAKTQSQAGPLNSIRTGAVIGSFIDSVKGMIPTVVQGGRVLSKVIQGDFGGALTGLISMGQDPKANPFLQHINHNGAPLTVKNGRMKDVEMQSFPTLGYH